MTKRPEALTLLHPYDLSIAFKDPSRYTWDAPVANLTGYRFLFNEVCALLPSFAGEEDLMESLELRVKGGWVFTYAGPACGEVEGARCSECGGVVLGEGEMATTYEQLRGARVTMQLTYDNLCAMYSPKGVVEVSFGGEFCCVGCGHPNHFDVKAELPVPYLLGVIHACEDKASREEVSR